MTDERQVQEQNDEKLINDAFQELLDRYLESKHRKKVEIITKAFNFARQAHKGVLFPAGPHKLPHRRPQGGKGMDDRQGHQGPSGGGQDTYRL